MTQLVEWLAVNQHVTGSSPVGGAYGPVAQFRLERPAHNRAVMRSNRIRPTTIIALTFLLLYLFRRLRFVIRRASPLKLFGKVSMAGNQSNHNGMSRVRQRLCQDGAGDPQRSSHAFSSLSRCRMRVLDKRAPLPALTYTAPCSCGKRFIDEVFAHMYVIMREEGDLTSRDPLIAVGSPLIHPGFAMDLPPFLPAKSLLLLSGKVQEKAARRIVAEVPEVRGVVKTAEFVPGLVSHDSECGTPGLYAPCRVRCQGRYLPARHRASCRVQAAVPHPYRVPARRLSQTAVGCRPRGKTTGPLLCGCLLGAGDARPCGGVPWRAARGHERCLVCIGVLVGIQYRSQPRLLRCRRRCGSSGSSGIWPVTLSSGNR